MIDFAEKKRERTVSLGPGELYVIKPDGCQEHVGHVSGGTMTSYNDQSPSVSLDGLNLSVAQEIARRMLTDLDPL